MNTELSPDQIDMILKEENLGKLIRSNLRDISRSDLLKDSATSQGLSDSQHFLLLGFKAVGDSAKQVELAFLEAISERGD